MALVSSGGALWCSICPMRTEAISSTAHEAWHPDTKWENRGTIELALMVLMALSLKFGSMMRKSMMCFFAEDFVELFERYAVCCHVLSD